MSAVEWKKLGDVCDFQNGFAFKSNKFKEKGLGIVRITNIKDSILDLSSLIYFEESDYPNQDLKQYEIHKGDILIAMSGATTGKIGCSLSDEILYLNQRVGKFIPCEELDNRYLYHLLKKDEEFFYQLAGGGAQPNLSSIKLMDSYCFYLPSIAKQQEIVSHLDTFTTLISNLESELDMRRKQYEHYRNHLLDFEGVEGVEWKTLGEVCKIMNGKDYKSLSDGNVPVYGSGGIMAYVDTFVYNRPSVLLPRKGSLNNVFYVDEPFWTVDTIYWTIINEEIILPKYFYCYMAMQNLEKLNIAAGAVPSLTQSILNKINIPLPTIFKQQEIVEKLDAFENLIQSLEQEIKLRKQQYEYYREKLLTFEYHG